MALRCDCTYPAFLGQAAVALNALHQLAMGSAATGMLRLLMVLEVQLWPLLVLSSGQQASVASVQRLCHHAEVTQMTGTGAVVTLQ